MVYRIKDWDIYENSRSRQIKDCTWTPIPNKQSGLGYKKLVTGHKNGTAHYGAWVAIVLRCSKQHEREGYLTDGGKKTDTPLSVVDLALVTSIPESIIKEAIPRFVDIGWLEVVDKQQPVTSLPQGDESSHPFVTSLPPNRIEEKGIEGNRIEEPSLPPIAPTRKKQLYPGSFESLWKIHPKGNKKPAYKKFRAINPDNETLAAMTVSLFAFLESGQWKNGYAQDLSRWLNEEGWENAPPVEHHEETTVEMERRLHAKDSG